MNSEPKNDKKKKGIGTVIVLILVLAAIAGIVVFELNYFGVIYKPQYLDIPEEGLGSAKKLEGKTALITIFASDSEGKWDFSEDESVKRRRDFLDYTQIAADWLIEQGKRYGKDIGFLYAHDENDSDFYYEHNFGDICIYDNFYTVLGSKTAYPEWDYIDKNIDSDAIMKKYDCQNIVYCMFLNYHEENEEQSLMLNTVRTPLEKPYEIEWIPYQVTDKIFKEPISIAHEMLHLFGAPDYYMAEGGRESYQVPVEFVEYCEENCRTDIMFVTGGIEDRIPRYDGIDAEITDITAYYIGWIDKAPWQVDHYRMVRSQFDRQK